MYSISQGNSCERLDSSSFACLLCKSENSFLAAHRENVHTAYTDRNMQAESVLLAKCRKDTG